MSTHVSDDSAAERNKRPIFDALVPRLRDARRVLEVGAGDATHARYAGERLPDIVWQTSEAPGHHRRLLAALADQHEQRLPIPLALDVRGRWPDGPFDVVYGANVAHIMDWTAVQALFAGTARILAPDGMLCLYGPFVRAGVAPEAGNAVFDGALRARDAGMGLREIEALDALGEGVSLLLEEDIGMPSDNRLLIWRKPG